MSAPNGPTDPTQPQQPEDPFAAPPTGPVPPMSANQSPYGTPSPSAAGGAYPPAAPGAEQPAYGVPPQAPYGAPPVAPYGAPQGMYAPVQKTDGVSIAAFVTGIVGTGPVAIVLGAIGMSRVKKDPQLKGRGFAIAGLVLGALATISWIIVITLIVLAANAVAKEADGYLADCRGGDMAACDRLARYSGEKYQDAADTCGGTQPAGSMYECAYLESAAATDLSELEDELGDIEDSTPDAGVPPETSIFPDEAAAREVYDTVVSDSMREMVNNETFRPILFAELTTECNDGDLTSCDVLGYFATPDEPEWTTADTCGGQIPDGGRVLRCAG